ncbi:hypothetical protein DO72_2589 [Burkholderia pseudomallei]|nr:hypothetical protein DO72_2589 [Burkholderia pseudomallei]KGW81893.1 hypothetical protein Y034_5433 [Burkholderia pseudomallei MSHR449]KGX75056.1 hypothetical protein Y033_4785 [Burkholderia pseudomallei MSHR435]
MNRVAFDNDLLAACARPNGRLARAVGMILAYGITIGCVWFLCAAFRADALR